MKTIRILSTAAIIAAAITASVLADDTASAGRRGPRGQGPGQRRPGPPAEIVAKYDTNQDGKLDETERAALQADIEAGKITRPEGGRGPGAGPRRQGPPPEIVAQYDTNQDGKLDETERAALHADIEAGKITRPEGGRGPGAGPRRQGPPPEVVAQYDTNQDGKLDETERAALHADIEAGKVTLPEGGRGPGAGGRKGGGRGRAQQ